MTLQLMHLVALDRHQQLLKAAETGRQVRGTPGPIRISLPRLIRISASQTPCPTC